MNIRMEKKFKAYPWQVREDKFDAEKIQLSESVFSLSNENIGIRGYFDEGYSGESLAGCYVNGISEIQKLQKNGYRGMIHSRDFLVNTVDWIYVRIKCNGCWLDLAESNIRDYCRVLDLRSGVLMRRFVWRVDGGTELLLEFERFVSMEFLQIGGQRIGFRCLKGTAEIDVMAGLDFSRVHNSTSQNHWQCSGSASKHDFCEIEGMTQLSKQRVYAASKFFGFGVGEPIGNDKNQFAGITFSKTLSSGGEAVLTRLAAIYSDKTGVDKSFKDLCKSAESKLCTLDYDLLKTESANWWNQKWDFSDIPIDGDVGYQQSVRFSIFQLYQALHSTNSDAILGENALTGEGRGGGVRWNTEIYLLPFYVFNCPDVAKNILQFRHDTLPEARNLAKTMGLDGAFYPAVTINGNECSDEWQRSNLQLQTTTSIMYGIWLYSRVTDDKLFLWDIGAEILVEISRMLASRGEFNKITGEFGFYGVTGPDDYKIMISNNAYTNFMAKKTFEFTLEALNEMKTSKRERYNTFVNKLDLDETELADWAKKSERMKIPYSKKDMLFEQHDGYYAIPPTDISQIPSEEWPISKNWSYDRILRSNLLKQPDVLMFLSLYPTDFSGEQLEANFNFYEPLCIHESNISLSVHAILAAQIGNLKKYQEYFDASMRIDLDNHYGRTHEGLHLISLAGTWLNMVYGLGGLKVDGEKLAIAPYIPKNWNSYKFSIYYKSKKIHVNVQRTHVMLSSSGDVDILVFGEQTHLTSSGLEIEMPIDERR